MKAKGIVICFAGAIFLWLIYLFICSNIGYVDSNASANSNARLTYFNTAAYLNKCTSSPADGAYCGSLEKKSKGDNRYDASAEDMHDYLCRVMGGNKRSGYYYVYFKDGNILQAYWSLNSGLASRYGNALTETVESGQITKQAYAGRDFIGGYPVEISDFTTPPSQFVLEDTIIYYAPIAAPLLLPLIINLAVYGAVCTAKRIKKGHSSKSEEYP